MKTPKRRLLRQAEGAKMSLAGVNTLNEVLFWNESSVNCVTASNRTFFGPRDVTSWWGDLALRKKCDTRSKSPFAVIDGRWVEIACAGTMTSFCCWCWGFWASWNRNTKVDGGTGIEWLKNVCFDSLFFKWAFEHCWKYICSNWTKISLNMLRLSNWRNLFVNLELFWQVVSLIFTQWKFQETLFNSVNCWTPCWSNN